MTFKRTVGVKLGLIKDRSDCQNISHFIRKNARGAISVFEDSDGVAHAFCWFKSDAIAIKLFAEKTFDQPVDEVPPFVEKTVWAEGPMSSVVIYYVGANTYYCYEDYFGK